ncbi:MAG: ribosome recycling factor [Minisyncoccia bacterium]
MLYDFKKLKDEIKRVEEWLKKEFTSIRTGMASPALLDVVQVESYGQRMPVNQLANIGIEDAKSIRISPWDKTQTKEIEKAIIVANLGVSVMVDDKGLRIIFPDLTSERRTLLLKTAKAKMEDARESLRGIRDVIWNEIQAREKLGGMGEDDRFRLKDEMQKMIDEANKNLESIFAKKEKEVSL